VRTDQKKERTRRKTGGPKLISPGRSKEILGKERKKHPGPGPKLNFGRKKQARRVLATTATIHKLERRELQKSKGKRLVRRRKKRKKNWGPKPKQRAVSGERRESTPPHAWTEF